MTINAYPLQWPLGWKRAAHRKRANFKSDRRALSVADGAGRVLLELEHMGYTRDDIVISTNFKPRLDGLPLSGQAEPRDPGVAVYWSARSGNKVMATDQYDRVADNLAAIAATLEAMRAIERHGGAVILERAFTGFTALPPPGGSASKRTWRDVLGYADGRPQPEVLRARFRALASELHPDKGGTNAAMAELNLAYEQAKAELGHS